MGRGRSGVARMDSWCRKAEDTISVLSFGWYIWAIHETGCREAKCSLLWQWEISRGHWGVLILLVLGTEKGAKHNGNAHPQASVTSVTTVMIKALGWRDTIACSCSVQDLRFPSLIRRPGWFAPIMTSITSFSCYLLLLLVSQSSSLESSWCCSRTQYCPGPLWSHFIFRQPTFVLFSVFLQQAESCWFSDGRSLDGEVGERNIKTINFTYWNAWPGDTWSCGLSSLKADPGLSGASATQALLCTALWTGG